MTASSRPVDRTALRTRTGLLARAWAGLRMRDAVLLSLLPLAAVVLLFGGAAYDYARARQFDDWWSVQQSVAGAFSDRIHALLRLPVALALRHRFDPEAGDAGIIRLTVEGRTWDGMQGDPLAMWGEWVDGRLDYGATTIPVRLRKRGDNSIHWLTDKRSMTVRTPRDDFYKRFRSFGLSVKDVVPAYLANRLGSEFGILVPATEVVPVYLNNRFYGTYRFVELPDESFLRPFDRMPGNIFRADRAERGEYYKGVPRNVFENPSLWDRTAENDRWTSAGSNQLRLLLEDLRGTTFADHQRLMRRVDQEELPRLFAYLLVVGDPYHMDRVHNQLLYEDPSTQQLHPIPWDIRLLDLSRPQHPLNDLFQAVLRDPFVVDRTVHEIGHRVADDQILRVADSLLQSVDRRFGAYLQYDRSRTGLVPDVGSTDEASAVVRRNVALLRRWVDDAAVAYHASSAEGDRVLDFETRGRVGADLVALRVSGPVTGSPELRLDRNRDGRVDPSDPTVQLRVTQDGSGHRLVPASPVALLASWSTDGPGVAPGHMPYRLFLRGVAPDSPVIPELRNRVTGASVEPGGWETGSLIRPPTGWHPWQYPRSLGRSIRLAGVIQLNATVEVAESDTLIIEPGTTLRLAPDVSIISRGLVLAEGTAARPIRILPVREDQPWGAFSLQGEGADRSVFRWIEFAQGGGALVDRIEYTGMVNIHRVHDVVVDHATFRDNLRSDDTFHALHATFRMTNSRFIRANSDALDLDISTGDILDNSFEASGGDAIDLMTSTPRIIGNVIRGSGDKGISIGEASRPFIFDNLITNCARGIEVKDRSDALILNNELDDNGVGLRERRKNWRYGGGGWATVVNTVFRDNRVPRERDSLSRITYAGVIGLGDDVAGGRSAELDWLYRAQGVATPPAAPGRLAQWAEAAAVAPVQELRFVDDFGPVSDGWIASGGITRLDKRRDVLRLHVERERGSAAKVVDWNLERGGDLVLEVAGRDLALTQVVAWAGRDTVTHVFQSSEDLSAFRFIVVPLPPGRYDGVRLEVAPRPGLSHSQSRDGLFVVRAGRLELRRLAVYPAVGPAPVASVPAGENGP
jgi:parallel beta-helix repeat protein